MPDDRETSMKLGKWGEKEREVGEDWPETWVGCRMMWLMRRSERDRNGWKGITIEVVSGVAVMEVDIVW